MYKKYVSDRIHPTEGARLVTMRESTVEAEFFRYDEFEAGQICDW